MSGESGTEWGSGPAGNQKDRVNQLFLGLVGGVTAARATRATSRAAGTAAGFACFDDISDGKQSQNQQDAANNQGWHTRIPPFGYLD